METKNEIEQAIRLLEQQGFKTIFSSTSKPDFYRIVGGIETPYPPKKPRTKVLSNRFDILYMNDEWLGAFPAYGNRWIHIKKSELLSEIVSAVCNYFEMQNARTDPAYYHITHGIYWLQRAGLDTEITSSSDIRATFDTYEYVIHLGQNGWTVHVNHLGEHHEEAPMTKLRDAVEAIIDKHQRIKYPDKFA
jgi:hypothetical protein